jgi:hypothetical protein
VKDLRQLTTIPATLAGENPVQRLGAGIEGAWRWWVNEGAHSHTTSALIELGLVLLLAWCVSWAVRLEIDRACARRRRRDRLQVDVIERPHAGERPPPVVPPGDARREPGA